MYQAKSNASILYSPFVPSFKRYLRTLLTRALTPVVLLLVLLSMPASTHAQSDATSADSEEITRLKLKKERIELERDIEKAEKEKREAQFPKPTTSPLSGETKIHCVLFFDGQCGKQRCEIFKGLWSAD